MKTKKLLTITLLALIMGSSAFGQGFSNLDYYLGTVWHYGKIADAIPEISENASMNDYLDNAAHRREFLELLGQTTATLQENHPEVLSSYKVKMESGDPIIISAAIAEAKKATKDIILSSEKLAGLNPEVTQGTGHCLALALHNVVAITAVAYLYIAVAEELALDVPPAYSGVSASLLQEQIVTSIATKFAG